MRIQPGLLIGLLLAGCSGVAPSTSDGVGSNTNWYRTCDTDVDCGEELSCICGACSQLCKSDRDCAELEDGICPVDVDSFRAFCEQDGDDLSFEGAACVPSCVSDEDCLAPLVCGGEYCVAPARCELATSLEFKSSSANLRARFGGFFSDDYYLPTRFGTKPADYVEPIVPSILTATLRDAAGTPLEGCAVQFNTSADSGSAYAENLVSDAAGEVTALWVAGPGASQSLSVSVETRNATLTAELSGTALDFASDPQATDPEARSVTQRSPVIVEPDFASPTSEISLQVRPITFPARAAYVFLDTGIIDLTLFNRSNEDATELNLSVSERTLDIRVLAADGVQAEIIFQTETCFISAEQTVCTFNDAWYMGETLEVLVTKRELESGEAPSDYDPQLYSEAPCEGLSGCTDYAVSIQREGGSLELIAVLRAPTVDTLTTQRMYLSHEIGSTAGEATSCLETARSEMIVRHSAKSDSDFMPSTTGKSYGSYLTWQNHVCANYSATVGPEGFRLVSGGPDVDPTPNYPGENRVIRAR